MEKSIGIYYLGTTEPEHLCRPTLVMHQRKLKKSNLRIIVTLYTGQSHLTSISIRQNEVYSEKMRMFDAEEEKSYWFLYAPLSQTNLTILKNNIRIY